MGLSGNGSLVPEAAKMASGGTESRDFMIVPRSLRPSAKCLRFWRISHLSKNMEILDRSSDEILLSAVPSLLTLLNDRNQLNFPFITLH